MTPQPFRILIFWGVAALLAPASGRAQSADLPEKRYDLVVIGGTSSGLGAAVMAARNGLKVALVERTTRLGGMVSSGVSKTDLNRNFRYNTGSSGLFEEFRQKVRAHYNNHPDCDEGLKHEPEVANRIFKEMVRAEANVETLFETRPVSVLRTPLNRVLGVVVVGKGGQRTRLLAPVTLDATDEGDVAAWAGAQYRTAREARSPLEPHAGIIYYDRGGVNASSKFIVHRNRIMPESTGEADAGLQGYSFRMTLKDYGPGPKTRPHVLKSPPPGYDRAKYVHGVKWEDSWASFSGKIPNGKHDTNNYPYGVELPGGNRGYLEASYEERQKIIDAHKQHALGYLYYLQQEEGKTNLGLANDEYPENGNFPVELYVRQGRRILGDYLLNEADINPFLTGDGIRPPTHADGIAHGTYVIDIHPVRPMRTPQDMDSGEGELLMPAVAPFLIPYRCLVPTGVEGLLVGQAVSSTHIGYQGTRLETTRMQMGMAAGLAAVLSLRDKKPLREVNVTELQDRMLAAKSILVIFKDVPVSDPAFVAVQKLSLADGFPGYEDYTFRPAQPVTRAQAVEAVVKSLKVPVSVTAFHFKDLPRTHPLLRYAETFYDREWCAALGVKTDQYAMTEEGYVNESRFDPEAPVTEAQLEAVLDLATGRPPQAPNAAPGVATRGRAAELIFAALR